jgi:PEP-CTERM motif
MAQKVSLGVRVKILKALVLALLAWSTAPAQAAIVNFGYVGVDRTPPTIVTGAGQLITSIDGVGSFSFQPAGGGDFTPQSGTFGLTDLATFSLDTGSIFTFSQVNPSGFPASAFYSYGLSDLTSFSATFADGILTALSFDTPALFPVSTTGGGGTPFTAQRFRVTGLGLDGVQTLNAAGDILSSGQFEIAAVPEPASWALMIIGFGMVGASLRSRRRQIRFA